MAARVLVVLAAVEGLVVVVAVAAEGGPHRLAVRVGVDTPLGHHALHDTKPHAPS